MTDSEVEQLKRGDTVHAEYGSACVPYTVTAGAQPSKAATHYEAWASSPRGHIVAKVTYSGNYHLPSLCPHRTVFECQRGHRHKTEAAQVRCEGRA
jgi:hypothetical protein